MKRLTLTFDNGPWADGATDDILRSLSSRKILATFFIVANRLEDPAALAVARRAKADGHWIGNHTYSHRQPLGLMDDVRASIDEVALAEGALGDLAGDRKLFRPPGKGSVGKHLLNSGVADYLEANKFTIVTWNNVPRDWEDQSGAWVDRAFSVGSTQDWSVLVVHDHHLKRLAGSLELFLDKAQAADIEIVQDFPADCTPMINGARATDFNDYVSP